MKDFKLDQEVNKKISSKRMRTWRWTTAVSCVPKKAVSRFLQPRAPKLGDLGLVRVTSLGAHQVVENASGSRLAIFPGSVLVVAFANRYAPDEFEGEVPAEICKELDLLNAGGTIGKVLSGNSTIGLPTKLEVLGFLGDENDCVLNTLSHCKEPKKISAPVELDNRKLVIITGTSMNSGKSNSAKAVVYALTSAGKSVSAGKVTGTASKKDALLMKTAGAIETCDFVDFGYPSTYKIGREKLEELFWSMVAYLKSKTERDGFIVIEIADGIMQPETEMILSNKKITEAVAHFVFSCVDSLSAIAGHEQMLKRFDIEISAISGPSANSSLGIKEVRRFLPMVPTFNNMILDVATTASIFLKDKPSTIQAVEERANEIAIAPETAGEF